MWRIKKLKKTIELKIMWRIKKLKKTIHYTIQSQNLSKSKIDEDVVVSSEGGV